MKKLIRLLALVLISLACLAPSADAYPGHWTSWAYRPWTPRDLSGVRLWLRADRGITLGTTPLASGTTPPAVTISGALSQAIGLYIQIDGAGARGTATFKWSENNGTSFRATGVLTAASVNIATTGGTIAVTFPVGTYATDDIYKGTVATWADQSLAGNDATNTTASTQPTLTASAANGFPAIAFDGTGQNLAVLASGMNISSTLTMVLVFKTAANGSDANVWGQGVGGGGSFFCLTHHNNGTAFFYLDAGGNNASVSKTGSLFDVVRVNWDGTGGANAQVIALNGAAATHTSTFATALNTSTAYSIGGAKLSTSNWTGQLEELFAVNRVLTAAELANVERYAGHRAGVSGY